MERADMVIVTKTPLTMKPIDRRMMTTKMALRPFQELYFTTMSDCDIRAQFPDEAIPVSKTVVLLSGVGNPKAVYTQVSSQFKVEKYYAFPDHHIYRVKELKAIVSSLAQMPSDTIILTTEKDAVKMTKASMIPAEFRRRLYVMPIKLSFPDDNGEDLIKNIYSDVKENRKRS
jgi:tetraacyldisaccharide 4'-kinase